MEAGSGERPAFTHGINYFIVVLAMRKRKPGKFSATKAVKANARQRVGQPKSSRVIQDKPRSGRDAKYKAKVDELMRGEE